MKTEEYFTLTVNSTENPNVRSVKRDKAGNILRIEKTDVVTVAQCKEIVKFVERNIDGKVNYIQIDHSKFESEYEMDMDNCGIRTIDKKYIYNVAQNCLTIYKNGTPVYCNDDGYITKDCDALADCLL